MGSSGFICLRRVGPERPSGEFRRLFMYRTVVCMSLTGQGITGCPPRVCVSVQQKK